LRVVSDRLFGGRRDKKLPLESWYRKGRRIAGGGVWNTLHFEIVIQNGMHFKKKVLSLKSLVFQSITARLSTILKN
jgi:hypothetical protein